MFTYVVDVATTTAFNITALILQYISIKCKLVIC